MPLYNNVHERPTSEEWQNGHAVAAVHCLKQTDMQMQSCSTCFVISGVLDEVLLEDTHEDGGQEASQQQHRHTRVDDAEPVNLHEHRAYMLLV